jgi:hypothetical protein
MDRGLTMLPHNQLPQPALLSAIEARYDEALADEMTRQVKAGLLNEVGIYLNFDPEHAQV